MVLKSLRHLWVFWTLQWAKWLAPILHYWSCLNQSVSTIISSLCVWTLVIQGLSPLVVSVWWQAGKTRTTAEVRVCCFKKLQCLNIFGCICKYDSYRCCSSKHENSSCKLWQSFWFRSNLYSHHGPSRGKNNIYNCILNVLGLMLSGSVFVDHWSWILFYIHREVRAAHCCASQSHHGSRLLL